jgi:nitric oxide reductase large subunit
MERLVKRYLLDLLLAIPLSLGIVFTILCVSNALVAASDSDKGINALILGVIGIPLLYASSAAILRRDRALTD